MVTLKAASITQTEVSTDGPCVPNGYKRTEIGIIPNDWEIRRMGDVCTIAGRIGFRGYTITDIVDEGDGVITISPSNISDDRTNFAKCTFLSWMKWKESPEIQINNGDILLVKTGSTVGKTAIVRHLPMEATLNPQVVVLKKRRIDDSFLGYVMAFEVVQSQITATVVGGALPTLSQKHVSNFLFPCPTRKTEPEAIARALSDADTLIESLEHLIFKKRQIKQGAMQELLTGKKRLPGFAVESGTKQTEVGIIPQDWAVVPLSSCLRRAPTYGINAPAVPFDMRLPTYLRITDISEDNKFVDTNKVSVKHFDSSSYVLEDGDIVFARTGASVGKSYLYNSADGPLVFAGFLIRISPNSQQLIPGFLSFFVQSRAYWNWIRSNSMRSGQPGINGREYASLPIPLPPTKVEQEAIISVLSDMDAEITALEAKRAKASQIKQGMMQELLTGRIRLV